MDRKTNLDYEERLVAFIDILGFKNIIEDSTKDPSILKNLSEVFNRMKYDRDERYKEHGLDDTFQRRMTFFSDCAVISYGLHKFSMRQLLFDLTTIAFNLAGLGYLLRGGVTIGKLYHDDDIVLGPALVEAYTLESKIAINPRIILGNGVLDTYYEKVEDSIGKFFVINDYLQEDEDGYSFVDYLQNKTMKRPVFQYRLLLSQFNYVFCVYMSEFQDDKKVFNKYLWTVKYIRHHFEELRELTGDPYTIEECVEISEHYIVTPEKPRF